MKSLTRTQLKMAQMPVMVMGDSNIRNSFVKEIFDTKLKQDSSFILTNSKESLSAVIEKHSKTSRAIVFHCSWMNEIVSKTRGKDEEAKDKEIVRIIDEIIDNLFKAALEKPDWTIIVMKPIRRKLPAAFDLRAGKICEWITESFYRETPPNNLKLKGAPLVEDKHFVVDGVHLNREGYLLLQNYIIDQIANTIQENVMLEEDEDFEFEPTMESGDTIQKQTQATTQTATKMTRSTLTSLGQTPIRASARNKRNRESEDEEGEKDNYSKKIKQTEDRMEAILGKMESIMEVANIKVDLNTKKIADNADLIQANYAFARNRFCGIDLSFARLKEESDVSENERMRDTIIIKKLISADTVTTKAQDLIDLVKKLALEMITDVMETDVVTRYIGLAYPIEPTRMAKAPKEVPPIKIQFRNREDSLDFRSKSIILAKKPNGKYSGVYLVHPMNAATRIRVSIMWILAKALKDADIEAWVAQSTSKPMLMVKKGQYPKSYGFVQAVLEHENFINKCDFTEPNKLATRFFKGEVQRLFIVLGEEMSKGKAISIYLLILLLCFNNFCGYSLPSTLLYGGFFFG